MLRILTVLLLLGMTATGALAAKSGKFVVSDASGNAGDTVTVTVSVEDNPGIIAAALQVHYDTTKLQLVSVKNEKLIGGSATFSQTYADHPYYASWNDALATENNRKDGVLMTLSFRILEDCSAGGSEITLTYNPGDVFDKDYNDQAFMTVAGTVTVTADSPAQGGGSAPSAGTVPPVISSGTGTTPSVGAKPLPTVSSYDRYSDLKPDGWYREYITYMLDKGYMNGVDANRFDPNGNMTRSQLVTILYRSAGSPAVRGGSAFGDVKKGSWYENAVAWSSMMGIVNGVGDGQFAPSGDITREQLAAILYRYSGSPTETANHLAGFTDQTNISSYAKAAMNWAVGQGILNGTGDGALSPKATATRAQTAAMLTRYLKAASAVPVPDVSVPR